jgi:type IV secretory pathway protease TraF
VVADPRRPGHRLVKRVADAERGRLIVLGDNPGASTDSRHFGPVPSVWARVVYRYHPRTRAGRVR